MEFWDMLGKGLMLTFKIIGVLVAIFIILVILKSIMGFVGIIGKSFYGGIKELFSAKTWRGLWNNISGKQSLQEDALLIAFKKYKKEKGNITYFWEDLHKENPEVYTIYHRDFDKRNNKLIEWDKIYPRKIRKRAGGYDTKTGMRWDGYKEIEVWDD